MDVRTSVGYACRMSGPTAKPKPAKGATVFVPHPDDEADVREGFAELERGEGVTLTREQVERWADAGELPEPVEQWAEPQSSSRRGT